MQIISPRTLRVQGIRLMIGVGLLSAVLSVQAQDVPLAEPNPQETAIVTDIPSSDPLPTEVVLTDAAPEPTQEITPAPADPTAISTQEVVVTPAPTQEATLAPIETVLPTQDAAVPTEAVLPLAFSASFDAAYPAELSAQTGWIEVAVTNGKALQAGAGSAAVSYQAATFTDAAVEARFLLNGGEALLRLRGYAVGIKADGTVTLYADQTALISSTASLISNEWTTVRLEIVGSRIQALVNDETILDYTADSVPTAGSAGFAASYDAILRIDDFAIYGTPAALTPVVTDSPAESTDKTTTDTSAALPMNPISCPAAGKIAMASVNGGNQGSGANDGTGSFSTVRYESQVSDDGRYVVFASLSSNLVTGDSNNSVDIFRFDRTNCTTIRVSVDYLGNELTALQDKFSMSDNGNRIAFSNQGTVYVRDIIASTTYAVGNGIDVGSNDFAISGDGLYVALVSYAGHVAQDLNSEGDVYRVEVADPFNVVLVSVSDSEANEFGAYLAYNDTVAISNDGSKVIWVSTGDYGFGLTDYSCNTYFDNDDDYDDKCFNVFWRDITNGVTKIASVNDGGGTSALGVDVGGYGTPSLSGDGSTVAFNSYSSYDPLDTDTQMDVYVHNMQTDDTAVASLNYLSQNTTDFIAARTKSLSDDGSRIAMEGFGLTAASVQTAQVYVRNLTTGMNVLASVNASGVIGGGFAASLSSDGAWVTFPSSVTTLVPNDNVATCEVDGQNSAGQPGADNNENCYDIFVAPVPTFPTPLTTPTNVNIAANGLNVTVTWTDTNTQETRYEVERYVNTYTTSIVGYTSANAVSFTENNLGCGLTLWYRVRAFRASDGFVSPWSGWMSVSTIPCASQVCNPEAALQRVSVGSHSRYQTTGLQVPEGRTISDDGRYVMFGAMNPLTEIVQDELSAETELGALDVYIYDTLLCTTSRISVGQSFTESAVSAYPSAILNGNGFARGVFTTASNGLVDHVTDTADDMDAFVRDLLTSYTEMVSLQDGGTVSLDGSVSAINATADGRYILMSVSQPLTVPGIFDDNMTNDLVVYDRMSNTLMPVTVNAGGDSTGNYFSFGGEVLVDPATNDVYAVFSSYATDLVNSDIGACNFAFPGPQPQPCFKVYVRNLTTGQTTSLSAATDGTPSNGASILDDAVIYNNMLYVTFQSLADSLVSGVNSGTGIKAYVRTVPLNDLSTGTTQMYARGLGLSGVIANGPSYSGQLSADGRWIAFTSAASNLVAGDTANTLDVFVRDLVTNETRRVAAGATVVDMNAEGTRIIFRSVASTLVTGDTANICETDGADSQPGIPGVQGDYNENCDDLFVMANPLSVLGVPATVTATTTLPTQINLTWKAVSGAAQYNIEAYDGLTWNVIDTVNAPDVLYPMTGLTCGQTHSLRVRSVVNTPFYRQSAASTSVTGKTLPCPAPMITSPTSVFLNTSNPIFEWTGSAGIDFYTVELSTVSTFATFVVQEPMVFGNAYTFSSLADGLYYLRIRASSPGTGANVTRSFTIDTLVPAAPMLTLPANLEIVRTPRPTFKWAAVPGAVSYTLEVLDPTLNVIISRPNLTVLTYTHGEDLRQGGPYTVRLRSKDAAGNESVDSPPVVFTINPAKSPAPNAVIPATGPAAKVVFTWEAGLNVTGYTIEIDDDQLFASPITCPVTPATAATCTLNSLTQGAYYWRVLRNGEMVAGGSTPSNKFFVSPAAPPAPKQLTPINGKALTLAERSNIDGTLTWGWPTTTVPAGGPFTYVVEISTSSTFNNDPVYLNDFLDEALDTLPEGLYYWRVRALNTHGLAGVWSAGSSFLVDNNAPEAPTVTAPTGLVPVSTARPMFTWTPVQGAARYEVEVNDVCDGQTPFFTSGSTRITTTFFTMPATAEALPQGEVNVCVKAYDASENASVFSAPKTFNVFLGTKPDNGAFVATTPLTNRPTVTWNIAPGIVGQTITYKVVISNEPTFTTGVIHTSDAQPVTKASYAVPSSVVMPAGTYYWRVERYINGNVQDFEGAAESSRIVYMGALGSGPDLTPLPNNGLINDVTNLEWTGGTGGAGTTITDYEFVLSKSPTFIPVFGAPQIVPFAGPLQYQFVPSADQNRVTYYWRVRGLSNGLPVTNWSSSSLIVDTVRPLPPTITAPLNNDLMISQRPTFTWTPVAGATYRILIFDNDMNQVVVDQPVSTTSYVPSVNLPQHQLTVQVLSFDGVNLSNVMSAVTFYVRLGTTPANGSTVVTNKPTFSWAVVTGATGYRLEVDDDSDFSTPVIDVPSLTTTSHTPTTALTPGVYYWRIRSNAVNGEIPYANGSRVFTYSLPIKPLNLLSKNRNDVADTVINAGDDSNLTFTWNALTPPPAGYQVMFATTPTFTPVSSLGIYSTPLNLLGLGGDNDVFPQKTIYWRVRAAYDATQTSVGPWSDVKPFVYDTVAPFSPMTTFVQDSTVNTVRPTFTWAPSLTAIRYHFTLYTVTGLPTEEVYTPIARFNDLKVPATSYKIPTNVLPLDQGVRYAWSVEAEDTVGNISAGFGPRRFNVAVAKTPAYGEFLADTTPTFTWTPDTGAEQWQVSIATDEMMTNIVHESSTLLPSTVGMYTVPTADQLVPGVYYWRVVRTTDVSADVWTRKLYVVSNLASLTPQLVTPVNGDLFNASEGAGGMPFQWTALVPPSELTLNDYIVEIFTSVPTATSQAYAEFSVSFTSAAWTPITVPPDGLYYWRVRGRFPDRGPASAVRTFRIDTTPPGMSTLTQPVANAYITTTRTPVFTWTAATLTPSRYEFQLSNNANFTDIRYTAVLNVPAVTFTLPPSQALPNNQYYWRIVAYDAAGNLTASASRSLKIAVP